MSKDKSKELSKDKGEQVEVKTESKRTQEPHKQTDPRVSETKFDSQHTSQKEDKPKDDFTSAPPAESAETPQEKQVSKYQAPLPYGVVPDQVQVNQARGQVLNDIEALKVRVARLLNGSDYEDISKELVKAQDAVAKKLGLTKDETGGYVNPEQVEQK